LALREREQRAQRVLHDITSSASWKMTRLLRSAKRAVRRIKG
jgi:hypothetical protein